MRLFYVLLIIFFVSGCGFVKYISVPEGTTAGYGLKAKIVQEIEAQQQKYFPECSTRIVQTRIINKSRRMIFEEWTVVSCEEQAVYLVEITIFKNDKRDFTVRRIK